MFEKIFLFCINMATFKVVMSPRTPILEQLSGKFKDVKFEVFLTLSLFMWILCKLYNHVIMII